MRIITSKTDQTICNEFGRRGFLKLAGSAGFGVIVYSELGPISLAVGPANMRPAAGWKNFFAGFADFARSKRTGRYYRIYFAFKPPECSANLSFIVVGFPENAIGNYDEVMSTIFASFRLK